MNLSYTWKISLDGGWVAPWGLTSWFRTWRRLIRLTWWARAPGPDLRDPPEASFLASPSTNCAPQAPRSRIDSSHSHHLLTTGPIGIVSDHPRCPGSAKHGNWSKFQTWSNHHALNISDDYSLIEKLSTWLVQNDSNSNESSCKGLWFACYRPSHCDL